jgi:hypothetical protein
VPVSFAFDFPIWIKMFLGASGFLCVVYILLKVEKEKFKDTSEVLKQSL